MMLRLQAAALFVAGALLAALPAAAQAPEGPAIPVNSKPGFPSISQVAAAASGDFVVVWQHRGVNGQGPDRVLMRRFAANGKPRGREVPVNPSSPAAKQVAPGVAMAAGGNFIVVWEVGDLIQRSVAFGRCFAASGKALGPAFRLDPGSQTIEVNPAVAAAPDGSFVATWTSGPNPYGFQNDDILARRFAADGGPLGPAFKVVSPAAYFQNDPRVAVSGSGDFLVGWLAYPDSSDGPQTLLLARRFDATGHPLGEKFLVASSLDLYNGFDMVTADDGEALFVWRGAVPNAPPTDGGLTQYGILGRRFAADGTPVGSLFVIGETLSGGLYEAPAVAAVPGGGYFVAWSGGDAFPSLIFGQSLASDGTPQDATRQVNNDDSNKGSQPAVTIAPNAQGIVTWTAFQRRSTEIFVRRLAPVP
jgi:hypothetical protein